VQGANADRTPALFASSHSIVTPASLENVHSGLRSLLTAAGPVVISTTGAVRSYTYTLLTGSPVLPVASVALALKV
jgi:hypothetical protein